MMIYLIVVILLLLLSFRYDICRKTRGREAWYYGAMIVLILIAGMRWRVGTDTIAYINRFYHIYPTLDKFSFSDYGLANDPFYALINIVVKTLGGRFYMVQTIQAAIVNWLVFKYIKRHSQYIFTGVLFFFFISYTNYTMEVMRGSLSAVICLFGNDYIREKKWLKGYGLYLVALGFHAQTLVIFLLPSLFFLKLNKTGILVLIAALWGGYFYRMPSENMHFCLKRMKIWKTRFLAMQMDAIASKQAMLCTSSAYSYASSYSPSYRYYISKDID